MYKVRCLPYRVYQGQRPSIKGLYRGMGCILIEVGTQMDSFPLVMKIYCLLYTCTVPISFCLLNFEFLFIITKIVPF